MPPEPVSTNLDSSMDRPVSAIVGKPTGTTISLSRGGEKSEMTANQQSEPTLKITKLLPAPRHRVFQAWTTPGEISKWWKLGDDWTLGNVEVDLREGGKYHIGLNSTKDGSAHSVRGIYREIIPPERLVYTWIVEEPKGKKRETLVTVEFHEKDGSTELVLTHQGLTEQKTRESVQVGWGLVLGGLTRFLSEK
jgi:uncharacterized protein YndB with AHSA1/START domain